MQLLGLFHCISLFPYGVFSSSLSVLYFSPHHIQPSSLFAHAEKEGIHDNSTRMCCDYDTVVDGSDSTIMLKTVELSLFYPTAENLTPIFQKINSFQVYRSQPMSTSCCCFFLSKHFTFLCLQQSFYWEQRKSFIKVMVLCMMLNQSNFQASSKFAKLCSSLKIHSSATHSKCEMLPKFLGSWSICCPQAASVCPLLQ